MDDREAFERNLAEVRTLAQKAASDAAEAKAAAMFMSPVEDFDHQWTLASRIWLAHVIRCLDKAEILDADARKSIHAHLQQLGRTAEELLALDSKAGPTLDHFDLLVRILPPRRPGDSS